MLDSIQSLFTVTDLVDMIVIIIVVLALNLMAGYAGIPNFGMAVFVFIGAFALAGLGTRIALLLAQQVEPDLISNLVREHRILARYGENPSSLLVGIAGDPAANRIAVPLLERVISEDVMTSTLVLVTVFGLAIILGGLTGILASFAAARLKEDYLAIVLLAFSEMTVTVIFDQTDSLAGGPNGAWAVKPWPSTLKAFVEPITPAGLKSDLMIALIVSLVILVIAFLYAERIANSPAGRMLRAMRDDDLAISTYGRDVAITRLKVMAVGAALASIAGAVYATVHLPVKAVDYDRVTWTFIPWAMMILGGMANNWGVVLGAITIYIGKRLVYFYVPSLFTSLSPFLAMISNLFPVAIIIALAMVILVVITRRAPGRVLDFKIFRLSTRTIEVISTVLLAGWIILLVLASVNRAMIENIEIVRGTLPHIFVGLVIILVLYLRPQGIISEKPSKTLSKEEVERIKAGRASLQSSS